MTKTRQTRQKDILQKEVLRLKEFFTAEELFSKAKKEDKTMGIATVYRFLKELKKKNKIFTYTCNRKTIYSNAEKSHCHYVCEKTGRTIHFNINNLDFLKEIKSKIPGSINSFQIEIKGICKECVNKY
jgi:Fur family ferric uptake transcriptional regulator